MSGKNAAMRARPRRPARGRETTAAALCALLTTAVAWTVLLGTPLAGAWGLLLGAAVGLGLLVPLGRGRFELPVTLALWLGFVLLTFAPGWLVVGYIRYLLTGEALGN